MRRIVLLLLVLVISFMDLNAQLKSPMEYLSSAYTKSFTFHHDVVDYVKYVGDKSDYVQCTEYGRTNEGRPLVLCYISSPNNLAKLEQLKDRHLKAINTDGAEAEDLAIVWLSFGVHGNEAGATESSMLSLYKLANGGESTKTWLENTLVILDPCINPDGFARYTNWARMTEKNDIYPELEDEEHYEPWPNGRYNHYLFDLNRDWAWQTQVESQQRLKAYRSWMPHVHGDFHEMGYNEHYYFPPAAKPYHPLISKFQRDFQSVFGENNAKYFDQNDWMYFTKEEFDLFYPSYGDTYPMFNGAIGMTFEQAGHSMAGRAIITNRGDTLKLEDRINHHSTVALSTVEVASKNASTLIQQQQKYFKNNRTNPQGKFKSYVLKNASSIPELLTLLERNGIEYHHANESPLKKFTGYEYKSGLTKSFTLAKGDIIVDAYQNNSIMAQVLLDPAHELEDSLTYDITAWALPYAYDLIAYGLLSSITKESIGAASPQQKVEIQKDNYAVILPWTGMKTAKIVAALIGEDIKMTKSKKETSWNNQAIAPGSIFIWRKDQTNWSDALVKIAKSLESNDQAYLTIKSGYSNSGNDAGGNAFTAIIKPKALAIMGEGVSVFDYGQSLHYFEEVMGLRLSSVNVDRLMGIDLNKYNVLMLASGSYKVDEGLRNKLSKWVEGGGKLIVLGSACEKLANTEQFGLKNIEKDTTERQDTSSIIKYSEQDRSAISFFVPGAVVKTKIDNSHPLAYGMAEESHMLVLDGVSYKIGESGWNVSKTAMPLKYEGFIGSEAKPAIMKGSLILSESKGKGKVAYFPNNPLFRGFWYAGLQMISNAIFQL